MERITLYLKESYDELMNHVTWPSWINLQQTTVVVIVASLILAFLIFVMDATSNTLLDLIY
ncbi:MAG: preprotein translocase subunit SecE [Saprospiraceae bacterium]|nr:preprotein translocase subunit SecE [Saprospiraceae bacterium]MBP7699599.1 preprotein translocase subunit SecE [Saprospiraceae bacterium]